METHDKYCVAILMLLVLKVLNFLLLQTWSISISNHPSLVKSLSR